MYQTVELYSGAEKPFSKVAEVLGYATITVDPNPDALADIVGVVEDKLVSRLPTAPLIVWAAPPFADTLSHGENWEADGSFEPKSRHALSQIRNTIGLLSSLKPAWCSWSSPRACCAAVRWLQPWLSDS